MMQTAEMYKEGLLRSRVYHPSVWDAHPPLDKTDLMDRADPFLLPAPSEPPITGSAKILSKTETLRIIFNEVCRFANDFVYEKS